MTPVTISEAARQLNVHKSTISRQVRDGIIPNRGTDSAPMVDVDEAKLARASGLDRSKQRGPDSPLFNASSTIGAPVDDDDAAPPAAARGQTGGLDYQKARTAREGYQARLAQIELEKQLGGLLDKSEVVDAFFALGAGLREMMDTRRQTLASRLVGVTDVSAIAAILVDEDRKLQQAIAESFERRFVTEAADAA